MEPSYSITHSTTTTPTAPTARKKKEESTINAEKKPPPYGSKNYWEARYAQLNNDNSNDNNDDDGAKTKSADVVDDDDEEVAAVENENDDNPVAFHSWYFTFQDLKPIILPLILGGGGRTSDDGGNIHDQSQQQQKQLVGHATSDSADNNNNNNGDHDKTSNDDKASGRTEEKFGGKKKVEKNKEINNKDDDDDDDDDDDETKNDDQINETMKGGEKHDSSVVEKDPGSHSNDDINVGNDDDQDQDSWMEASENELGSEAEGGNDDTDDHDDDEEEDEIPRFKSSAGLAIDGPISILEIGCGDVPLIEGLAEELGQLQKMTGADASHIIKRLVCTDYSENVIDVLKRMHQRKRKQKTTKEKLSLTTTLTPTKETQTSTHDADGSGGAAEKEADDSEEDEQCRPVEFLVADARELPFPDESFNLIFEKGTMDACISDSEYGVENCIKIVSDCARVLAEGGCFFLVSHINAQSIKGEEWLENVVVTGLRKGGARTSSSASWSIEVHGSDFPEVGEEEDDHPPESAGPAVYLIFKKSVDAKAEEGKSDKDTIPLKFFTY